MRYLMIFSFLFLMNACFNGEKPHYGTLDHYDLNHPEVHYMPGALTEISGLAFHKGRNDTVYTEQDESGTVYLMQLNEKKFDKVTFKKSGDFEDIAILNDIVVMLRSDGVLFSFPIQDVWNRKIDSYEKWDKILPEGEYESLYADNASDQLYVVCKGCKRDNKKDRLSGFIFNLNSENKLKKAGEFKIDTKEILKKVHRGKKRFKPSALTFNPVSKEWYLVSNVNKALVVADRDWKIKKVINLDPHLYIQPEGMAFDKNQTFYISNEGSKTKKGTIFEFRYQP